MTKDAPAFDFYPERWTHGTRHMTKVERCDYLDLLCHQWTDDGLPADVETLARLLGYRRGPQVPSIVLEKFPVAEDGKRRNGLLEKLRAEQRERIRKAKEKSEKMHASRYGKQCLTPATSSATSSGQALLKTCPPPTTHHIKRESSAGAWPSLDEVKAYAPTVMAPPECAERYWNECEAAGWINRHGQPIADWKPLFRNYATSWKSNDAQRKTNANARQTPTRTDSANLPGRYS